MDGIAGKVAALTLIVFLSLWAGYLSTVSVFVYLHDKAHTESCKPKEASDET